MAEADEHRGISATAKKTGTKDPPLAVAARPGHHEKKTKMMKTMTRRTVLTTVLLMDTRKQDRARDQEVSSPETSPEDLATAILRERSRRNLLRAKAKSSIQRAAEGMIRRSQARLERSSPKVLPSLTIGDTVRLRRVQKTPPDGKRATHQWSTQVPLGPGLTPRRHLRPGPAPGPPLGPKQADTTTPPYPTPPPRCYSQKADSDSCPCFQHLDFQNHNHPYLQSPNLVCHQILAGTYDNPQEISEPCF